jgi:phytoene synthase
MAEDAPGTSDAEVVRRSASSHDPDRYFAALLAPAAVRQHLLAIAAFGGEVMHVPFAVSEPMLGRIRLQWWREVLARGAEGASGHPVADAVAVAAGSGALDRHRLEGVIDAAEMLLETPAFRAEPDLFSFLDRGSGALFEASVRILGAQVPTGAAGRAHGIAALLDLIAWRPELGATLIPQSLAERKPGHGSIAELATIAGEALAEARDVVRHLPRTARPALLPLATVRGGVERRPLSRFTRIRRIALAALLGRI